MVRHIRKRSLLVILLSVGQLGFLAVGVSWYSISVERSLTRNMQRAALVDDDASRERVRDAVDSAIAEARRTGVTIAVILASLGFAVSGVIIARYESRLATTNANLEDLVARRTRSLVNTRDAIIFGLAKLAESRDDDTGEHLERIRAYVDILAQEMKGNHPLVDDEFVKMIGLASSLHDVGKVGIPDAVLLKPGRFTPEERAVIEKHTLIGGDCLMAIKRRLGEDDFLTAACEIAFSHHERWDGTGYPFGLAGENIPFPGRIVALADVYDALTSKRIYKDSMPHEKAAEIIVQGAGTHFDPAVVKAFLAREDAFKRLAAASANRDTEVPLLAQMAGVQVPVPS